MADEANIQPIANIGIPRVRDQQYREVYCNGTFIGMSPYDITLFLTKATDIGGGQNVLVDQVAVIMSPQHFKQFCRSASETLKAYESVFGELKIPDADIQPATKAEKIESMLLDARARAAAAREAINAKPATSSTEKKRPSRRSRGASRPSS